MRLLLLFSYSQLTHKRVTLTRSKVPRGAGGTPQHPVEPLVSCQSVELSCSGDKHAPPTVSAQRDMILFCFQNLRRHSEIFANMVQRF